MQLKRNERTRLSRSTHSLTHYRRGKFKSQLRSIALLSITNIAHSHSASRLRFPNTVIQNLAWLINQSITHSMNFFASGGRVGFFFLFFSLPFSLFSVSFGVLILKMQIGQTDRQRYRPKLSSCYELDPPPFPRCGWMIEEISFEMIWFVLLLYQITLNHIISNQNILNQIMQE